MSSSLCGFSTQKSKFSLSWLATGCKSHGIISVLGLDRVLVVRKRCRRNPCGGGISQGEGADKQHKGV